MTSTEETSSPSTTTPGKIGTVTLDDLFGPAPSCDCLSSPVEGAIESGYVRRQVHPTEPLAILNYTEKCANEGAWDAVTTACRGLIYHTETGRIIARGFNKFMNHGQVGAAEIPLDARVNVTDKADGSLGIIYWLPSGGWAVATRGSFASDQALHATEVLNTRYPDYRTIPGGTTLVEIVYPQNRIVLDYSGLDDLILLGGVVNATGEVWGPDIFASDLPTRVDNGKPWTGPVTTTFHCPTFADALAMEPRTNAEGIVVRDLATGAMLKLKQADYVRLHALVTNLTARKVHEHMLTGEPLSALLEPLPDEFWPWVKRVAADINRAVALEAQRLGAEFAATVDAMPLGWELETVAVDRAARATFARVAAQHPDKWALFAMLDERPILPEILKRAQPAPFLTPTGVTHPEEPA